MSDIQAAQVKITLPYELYARIKSKAEHLGLNLASYVRHLVITDVKDVDVPMFKLSEKNEKVVLQSLEDYKSGRTKAIDDIDSYLASM